MDQGYTTRIKCQFINLRLIIKNIVVMAFNTGWEADLLHSLINTQQKALNWSLLNREPRITSRGLLHYVCSSCTWDVPDNTLFHLTTFLINQGPVLRRHLVFCLQHFLFLSSRVPKLRSPQSSPNWRKFGPQRPQNPHGPQDLLSDICLQSMKFPESSKRVAHGSLTHLQCQDVSERSGLCFLLSFPPSLISPPLPPAPLHPPIQPYSSCQYGLRRGRGKMSDVVMCHLLPQVSVPGN